jgi:hypothetical protein
MGVLRLAEAVRDMRRAATWALRLLGVTGCREPRVSATATRVAADPAVIAT